MVRSSGISSVATSGAMSAPVLVPVTRSKVTPCWRRTSIAPTAKAPFDPPPLTTSAVPAMYLLPPSLRTVKPRHRLRLPGGVDRARGRGPGGVRRVGRGRKGLSSLLDGADQRGLTGGAGQRLEGGQARAR